MVCEQMSVKFLRVTVLLMLLMSGCGPGDRLISVSGIAPKNKSCVLYVDVKSVGSHKIAVSGEFEEFYSSGEWAGESFSKIEVSCEGKTIYKKVNLPFVDIDIGSHEY